MLSALTELRDIVLESDISPFEMNYSGLIKALLNYLTTTDAPGNRYDRLRMFWKLFAESTVSKIDSFIWFFFCASVDAQTHRNLPSFRCNRTTILWILILEHLEP